MIVTRSIGGSGRPGEDVDVLFVQQPGEQGAVVRGPGSVVRIEEATNQQVGFLRPTMVGSPVEAFQLGV